MQTLTPRSNQARFRLSLLCSSTRISRYEQTLFERLAQDGSAQLHRAIVMPAVSTGRQSFWRIAPRLVNHIVQFAEWQFLKLLPARFSGLGWRGRSVMPGSTDVVTVFNTVSRLDTSLSSGAVQTPAPGTAEVVVCTEPALYKTARSSIPEAHWIVIDGLGDRSSQTTAGFSAVFSGRDTTDFRILIWRAGQPLPHRVIEGKNRTKLLYLLNQAALWDRITSCLLTTLAGVLPKLEKDQPQPNTAASSLQATWQDKIEPAGCLQLIAYGFVTARRLARVLTRQLTGKRLWSIVVASGDPLRDVMQNPTRIFAPPGYFYADPMLLGPINGKLYCFVEEFDNALGKAAIAVLEQQNDDSWQRLGIAVTESFHLSFPYLFEYNGHLYMCPESYLSNRITVYECVDFPLKWRQASVIMDDVSSADSVLFESDNKWWLLTNIDRATSPDHQSELHVFYADTPLSNNWTPLPENPVKIDPIGGRNGGFFKVGSELFRCGQCQSIEAYGEGLNLYRITQLDPMHYAEVEVSSMKVPASIGGSGTHTLTRTGIHYAIDILG